MPDHGSALRTLRESGHKVTVEYIQTLEAQNQLLQEDLELFLTLLAKQAIANKQSNVADRAAAVLRYTQDLFKSSALTKRILMQISVPKTRVNVCCRQNAC